jgi:UDP:flavonoid glycosyltransferase YjiC (YdhE family)
MKKIIIAPLNWGLGHATRCVPIIKELQKSNFTPIIASDGTALQFLIKEFPSLEFFELPSYKISYGRNLKWSLIRKIPTIVRAVHKERLLI